jgi:hypothetical protein
MFTCFLFAPKPINLFFQSLNFNIKFDFYQIYVYEFINFEINLVFYSLYKNFIDGDGNLHQT